VKEEERNEMIGIAVMWICSGLGFIFPIAAKWILFSLSVLVLFGWWWKGSSG